MSRRLKRRHCCLESYSAARRVPIEGRQFDDDRVHHRQRCHERGGELAPALGDRGATAPEGLESTSPQISQEP